MNKLSFTPDMVQAIVEGRKTQTRRKLGPRPLKVGEVVYVGEQWLRNGCGESTLAAGWLSPTLKGWRKHAGYTMPRSLARYYLRITAVREQRLQEITEAEATAEGFELIDSGIVGSMPGRLNPRYRFMEKWQSLHPTGEYAWENNPIVQVYEFERTEP